MNCTRSTKIPFKKDKYLRKKNKSNVMLIDRINERFKEQIEKIKIAEIIIISNNNTIYHLFHLIH